MLPWVDTVHIVWGLDLASAIVSFDLEKPLKLLTFKSFSEAQMYVALNRVTSIGNIFLIGKYNPNAFKVNENVIIEYSKLKENRFGRSYTDYVDSNSLKISWSLKRHAACINRARQLTNNATLCLTESQITNNNDGTDIVEQLSTFKIYFNSCGVRH